MILFYEVMIEGTKPILINTFPTDTLSVGKSKSGTTGNDEDSWKKTVLVTANGQLYVMNTYLRSAIGEGGKHIKAGRGNLSKKVISTLEVLEDQLFLIGSFLPPEPLRKPDDPVYIDVRSVVNPMTKGRNLRHRIAVKNPWSLKATISWDDRTCSKEDMKGCVENAGMFEGIGDGRKIGFGKFKLISFTSKN